MQKVFTFKKQRTRGGIMTPIEHYIIQNTEIEIEDLRAYFKCPKYAGKYFAQMKKEVCKFLKLKGLINKDIAATVGYAQHSMVTYALKHHVNVEKENLVIIQENWQMWVRMGVYPKSGRDNDGYAKITLVEKGEL